MAKKEKDKRKQWEEAEHLNSYAKMNSPTVSTPTLVLGEVALTQEYQETLWIIQSN